MKSSALKNCQLNLMQEQNSIGLSKYYSCDISKAEPLNERKAVLGMLPTLPKKKQNQIRARQLEVLRQKENKMLAFYFYQKSLTPSNGVSDTRKRKFSLGNSRMNPTVQKSKNARSINHYSFMQMRNTINEKTKYINEGHLNEFKVKKMILS